MKYCIITGGSKGIGEGIALKFKKEGYQIKSLARTKSEQLLDSEQLTVDLNNLKDTENVFRDIVKSIINENPSEVLLVNNAGTLGTVDRLENNSSASIQQAFHLNVTIPTVLSSLFIELTQELSIKKTIINISSGAAANPYYGWSVYCSSKAAIDMLTKVIAEEQQSAKYPVKALSIYPGVVDTNMQTQIRSRNGEQFAPVAKFIELKEEGLLSTPSQSAESIYKLFKDASLDNGAIVDVRIA